MRKIKNLLEQYPDKRLWVELSSRKLQRDFAKEIREMKLAFLNGERVKRNSCSNIMTIGGQKGVAHVSGMVYGYTFMISDYDRKNNIMRIDYAKYRNDADDYIILPKE